MDNMKQLNMILIMAILLFSLPHDCFSQKDPFLAKYGRDIEHFIMNGYSPGWKHCDVIIDKSEANLQTRFFGERPIFLLEIERLHAIDIQTTFSLSNCLLVSMEVNSNEHIADLIQFGWSVIQRKRLALVLKLGQGLTLDVAKNITKLPFLVAARTQNQRDQFLCPIIGDSNPSFQSVICNTTYKNKSLRVAVFGVPPDILSKYKS